MHHRFGATIIHFTPGAHLAAGLAGAHFRLRARENDPSIFTLAL